MRYNTLEKYASQPRMNRFRAATGNKPQATNLYRANLQVSQAFYPILNLTETFLRNALYEAVATHFSNTDWIIAEKGGFMSDASLARSGYYLKNSIVAAENKMTKKGITVSSGKVLAEQSFGFWVSLFENSHYRLIGGSVIHAFPHKPKHINRKAMFLILSHIRDFRNRIYHNEPICFCGNTIDFLLAIQIRQNIFEMLGWINPELQKYVEHFDTIDRKIAGFRF